LKQKEKGKSETNWFGRGEDSKVVEREHLPQVAIVVMSVVMI